MADFLDLSELPYVAADIQDTTREYLWNIDCHEFCVSCYNLYPTVLSLIAPLGGVTMNDVRDETMERESPFEPTLGSREWFTWSSSYFQTYQIQKSLPEIAATAASGCVTCMLLKDAITRLTSSTVAFDNPLLFAELLLCRGHALTLLIARGTEGDDEDDMLFPSFGPKETVSVAGPYQLYTTLDSPCPWPTIGSSMTRVYPSVLSAVIGGHATHVSTDFATDACFNTIKGWISSCKRLHAICNEADVGTAKSFPKRIVSIGSASNNEIRVVERDDSSPPLQEPYMALSHCWGKSRPLTLTKDTLEERKAHIPFEVLPRTFQDAVVITRGLGIRYIWIDSLCIIQNDIEDWEIEAAKMSSIYSDAELVLSATGSADSTAGVLQNRKPYLTWTGSYPKNRPFHIYGREQIHHEAFGWAVDERDMVKGSTNIASEKRPLSSGNFPLMTRAWCFQERLLATRILHFTKDEVIFDCLTSMECECGTLTRHEGDSHLALRRIVKTGHKYVSGSTSLLQGQVSPFDLHHDEAVEEPIHPNGFVEHHERWRDLIVQYSQKGITVTTDRLPAVGGLALRWSNGMTGRYLAGLWEKDLLRGLRWWPSEAETESGEECPYVAPSWSWVSACRGVTWGTQGFEGTLSFIKIDLARTECHLSGLNPYGEVDYGYIFLTGRVMEITFSVNADMVWLQKFGEKHNLRHPDSISQLRGWEMLGDCKLYCLRLCTKVGTSNAWDDDFALVLRKADGDLLARQPKHVQEFPNVYERVGLWTAYRVRSWHHAQDSVKKDLYVI
ncbi:hypothetical protein AK830_g5076 [Neonectria ditissima]|uniref:Heterokaryon incompatibility domain-containing protein n=1 Tax=Neonectria ditissima TaxID=78410 RepID=A0A0P7BMH6_9HYPO|nr:hypothetical protein AK830_g5076 [Neonectria ditissima]